MAVQVSPLQECELDAWTPSTLSPGQLCLEADALQGLAGEVVNAATANSEASPAAVLVTFLARFGCEAFNPKTQSPCFHVGESRHYPRLFVAICGQTAKARKGTSAKPVERLFDFPVSLGLRQRVQESPGPLSSGEGLIYAVRDARTEIDPETDEERIVDTGAKDKRLFVLDEELAAALKVSRREGNTLSTVLRGFWDSGKAAPITKSNRIAATAAHVCVVAHITCDELATSLQNVELLNGFGNRFLWVLAHREKMVPLPCAIPRNIFDPLQETLCHRIAHAHSQQLVSLTDAAKARWIEAYPVLSMDKAGLIGAVTDRAEAQVIRLALIYALLDGAPYIDERHILSGLAFWRYCENSARIIFAGRGENPLDEKILVALRQGPRTATEISNALGRNVPSADIKAALERLIRSALVAHQTRKSPTRHAHVFALRAHEINEGYE